MPTLTNDMMRSIIMDHDSDPQNKHQPSKEGYEKVHRHSDSWKVISSLMLALMVQPAQSQHQAQISCVIY